MPHSFTIEAVPHAYNFVVEYLDCAIIVLLVVKVVKIRILCRLWEVGRIVNCKIGS